MLCIKKRFSCKNTYFEDLDIICEYKVEILYYVIGPDDELVSVICHGYLTRLNINATTCLRTWRRAWRWWRRVTMKLQVSWCSVFQVRVNKDELNQSEYMNTKRVARWEEDHKVLSGCCSSPPDWFMPSQSESYLACLTNQTIDLEQGWATFMIKRDTILHHHHQRGHVTAL